MIFMGDQPIAAVGVALTGEARDRGLFHVPGCRAGSPYYWQA